MNEVVIHPYIRFDSSRISHAYIVAGVLADTLAIAALCSATGKRPCMSCIHCNKSVRGVHPDITIVVKADSKQEILIDQIREIRRDAYIVPNESDKKVYHIKDAHLMNINAQNALLRILEEPPTHTVFILNTDIPDALLPTVRSRCIKLNTLYEQDLPDTEILEVSDEFLAAIEGGCATLAIVMFKLEKLNKEKFIKFLNVTRERLAELLREIQITVGTKNGKVTDQFARSVDIGVTRSINPEILSLAERLLREAGEYLNLNVSLGHISGMICASLIDAINGD